MERAQELRQLRWLGYETGDIVAELRSETFADPAAIYRYSPVSKYLRLGPAGEDDESLSRTAKLLRKFKPAFISAYPSALRILTRWLARNKETIPPLKFVVTSSETLYPSIRQQAEEVLKCRVIDHYGQNELVACASQCAEAAGYHIEMEQNIVELIPSREGENEIVGTSLHNLSMPFLRYRTGDIGEMGHEPCPCGRKLPVLKSVKGRYGDIIVTPEGTLIPVATMTYPFFHVEAIREGQIVQEAIDTLRVKVVPWENYTDETEKLFVQKLNYYLKSQGMNIIVEKVTEIPRTRRGKKPFIISHLNVDDYI